MNEGKRVCKWDNLKCLLIVLVVVGHFANQFVVQSDCMRSVSIFIYSFHMPLFIFLSGLLEKGWDKKHPFRWSKPVYYVMIGYALKLLIYGIKLAFHEEAEFQFFTDTGIPWYMFAMAAFMVIMYWMRDLDYRICLPVWIVISCMAGYVEQIGSFLYLSRILVFFPFYYVGYLLDAEKVLALSQKRWVKCCSGLVVVAVLVVSIFKIDVVYSYIRLLTARNAYALVNIEHCGFEHRLLCYGISVIMGAAVLCLIPNRRIPFACVIGQKTLQIYFWHRLILYVVMFSGFIEVLKGLFFSKWIVIYLLIGVILTVMLTFEWFAYPLKLLKKQEHWIQRILRPKRTSFV